MKNDENTTLAAKALGERRLRYERANPGYHVMTMESARPDSLLALAELLEAESDRLAEVGGGAALEAAGLAGGTAPVVLLYGGSSAEPESFGAVLESDTPGGGVALATLDPRSAGPVGIVGDPKAYASAQWAGGLSPSPLEDFSKNFLGIFPSRKSRQPSGPPFQYVASLCTNSLRTNRPAIERANPGYRILGDHNLSQLLSGGLMLYMTDFNKASKGVHMRVFTLYHVFPKYPNESALLVVFCRDEDEAAVGVDCLICSVTDPGTISFVPLFRAYEPDYPVKCAWKANLSISFKYRTPAMSEDVAASTTDPCDGRDVCEGGPRAHDEESGRRQYEMHLIRARGDKAIKKAKRRVAEETGAKLTEGFSAVSEDGAAGAAGGAAAGAAGGAAGLGGAGGTPSGPAQGTLALGASYSTPSGQHSPGTSDYVVTNPHGLGPNRFLDGKMDKVADGMVSRGRNQKGERPMEADEVITALFGEAVPHAAVVVDGMSRQRLRFGDEQEDYGDECHDCGCKKGELHGPGCDVERCPVCGRQAITCPCDCGAGLSEAGAGGHGAASANAAKHTMDISADATSSSNLTALTAGDMSPEDEEELEKDLDSNRENESIESNSLGDVANGSLFLTPRSYTKFRRVSTLADKDVAPGAKIINPMDGAGPIPEEEEGAEEEGPSINDPRGGRQNSNKGVDEVKFRGTMEPADTDGPVEEGALFLAEAGNPIGNFIKRVLTGRAKEDVINLEKELAGAKTERQVQSLVRRIDRIKQFTKSSMGGGTSKYVGAALVGGVNGVLTKQATTDMSDPSNKMALQRHLQLVNAVRGRADIKLRAVKATEEVGKK